MLAHNYDAQLWACPCRTERTSKGAREPCAQCARGSSFSPCSRFLVRGLGAGVWVLLSLLSRRGAFLAVRFQFLFGRCAFERKTDQLTRMTVTKETVCVRKRVIFQRFILKFEITTFQSRVRKWRKVQRRFCTLRRGAFERETDQDSYRGTFIDLKSPANLHQIPTS